MASSLIQPAANSLKNSLSGKGQESGQETESEGLEEDTMIWITIFSSTLSFKQYCDY